MTYDVVVKFAPIFTADRFDNPKWARPGRTMYYPGALTFLPGKDSIPLLADHDDGREIGTVNKLFTLDWVDGPWICASGTVNDAPSWLARGCRVSFESRPFDRRDVVIRQHRADVVARAFVGEVSVLSPSMRPAEPRAEVLSFRSTKPARSPAAVRPDRRPAASEVINHPTRVIRRAARKPVFSDEEIRWRIALADESGIPGAVEKEILHMKALEAAGER